MSGRPRKAPREKDLTSRFFSGDFDEDSHKTKQRFTDRSKNAEQVKIEQTGVLRAAESGHVADLESLPIGQVVQVYSLFCDIEYQGVTWLCVVRKTLNKLSDTAIVVGDLVRFRDVGSRDESGRPEGVIEQVLPRKTILTRTGSFNTHEQHPIVANAEQMLIVASVLQPVVKWGLVDRMLIAAQSGSLSPIICLNKIDLAEKDEKSLKHLTAADEVLAYYREMGIATIRTSADQQRGIDEVAALLREKTTVLAGHSGVGKSTIISRIQPGLDIRIGAVSGYTDKGRHTTSSARRYRLNQGGDVIDTPGVKMFGLWGVTKENLDQYFPDVTAGTAPDWRIESHQRIVESLA